MSPKYLYVLFFSVLCSCKLKEKNISGIYHQQKEGFGDLIINNNHTFLYTTFNFRYIIKKLSEDSAQIGTKGTWRFEENKIVLNSFELSQLDTNRFEVSKRINNSGISKFCFKNELGDSVGIRGVSNGKEFLTYVFHTEGFPEYSNQTSKIDTLYFKFDFKKSWRFIKIDTISGDYTITIKSYYKPALFVNRTFTVKHSRLIEKNKGWMFRRKQSVNSVHHFFTDTQVGTSYRR